MEALASELLLRADSVAGIVSSVERHARDIAFEGPAAVRLRDELMHQRRRAERSAAELQEAAHTLKRSAAAIRSEMHELDIAERRARDRETGF